MRESECGAGFLLILAAAAVVGAFGTGIVSADEGLHFDKERAVEVYEDRQPVDYSKMND